jgi:hypothetical protein
MTTMFARGTIVILLKVVKLLILIMMITMLVLLNPVIAPKDPNMKMLIVMTMTNVPTTGAIPILDVNILLLFA